MQIPFHALAYFICNIIYFEFITLLTASRDHVPDLFSTARTLGTWLEVNEIALLGVRTPVNAKSAGNEPADLSRLVNKPGCWCCMYRSEHK
jgi:hypothetical protein